jgi:hypothetical protein
MRAVDHAPQLEMHRQQMLEGALIGAVTERGEALDHRNADARIDAGGLHSAGSGLAHRGEPPLHARVVAGAELGHRGVDVGEHQAPPVGVPLPQRRELPPAIADIAAERVEPPQQRRGVGQVRADRPLRGAHRPVIERECRAVLAELKMEQCAVPPDVHLERVARAGPERLALRHPAEPFPGTVGLLHDVRDGVVRPEAERLELGGRARLVLGAREVASLLQPEAVIGEDESIARLVCRPERQRARRPALHQVRAAGIDVEHHGRLVGDEVERRAHQVAVEHRGRGGASARDRAGLGEEMRLLPLVARERPDRLDKSLGDGEQSGVVGQQQRPALRQMGHHAIGRCLDGRVEAAERIAVHEHEAAHALVIGGGGLGRRAGEGVALGIADHRVLPDTGRWGGRLQSAPPHRSRPMASE